MQLMTRCFTINTSMPHLLSQLSECWWVWGQQVLQESWATHVFPSLRFCFSAWGCLGEFPVSNRGLPAPSPFLWVPWNHTCYRQTSQPHKNVSQTHFLSLPCTRMHHFPRISFTSISHVLRQAQSSSVTKCPLCASGKSQLDIGWHHTFHSVYLFITLIVKTTFLRGSQYDWNSRSRAVGELQGKHIPHRLVPSLSMC